MWFRSLVIYSGPRVSVIVSDKRAKLIESHFARDVRVGGGGGADLPAMSIGIF